MAIQAPVRPACAVDGCERDSYRRGWCRPHFDRWKRHGTPGTAEIRGNGGRRRKPVFVRFWNFVLVEKETGCWLWQGRKQRDGYANFYIPGISNAVNAHRWSYEFFVADIPEGLTIDHLCRVRHCVNPNHLEAVTFLENMRRGAAARRAVPSALSGSAPGLSADGNAGGESPSLPASSERSEA